MALNYVDLQIPYFADPTKGRPIFNGSIFIGEPDLDPEIEGNRKTVTLRQEDGTEVPIPPASQPLMTGSGGVVLYSGSPVQVLTEGNYSIKVLNAQDSQVYYVENALDGVPITIEEVVAQYDTLADLVADTTLTVGQTVSFNEYAAGRGGISGNTGVIVATATGTPDGGKYVDLANALQFEGLFPNGVHAKQYGADNTGVADSFTAFNSIRAAGFDCEFGDGTYLISDRVAFLAADSGLKWTGNCTIDLSSASAEYAFYIPAVGDGDLEVAGATDITWDGFTFDGTNATSGVAGFETWNAAGATVKNCKSNNWGLSGAIIKTTAAGETDILVQNWRATGNTNHGIAVATLNKDASRVHLDHIWSHGNGLGIDISTGSATVSNVHCWDNTNGGMKTAGNDDQHLIMNNCDLSDNTAGSAQGFYTNGTFKLIEMTNVKADNNGAQGIQIAHAGTVLGANISTMGNGNIGFHQSGAANTAISSLKSEGNSNRGVLIGAGDAIINGVRTKDNDRVGILVSSTGYVSIDQHTSIDDCQVSDNNAIFFQPAAGGGAYTVGQVVAVDTGGSGGVATALSLNGNCSNAHIGSINTVGAAITNPISDGGTDTTYVNAGGLTKLASTSVTLKSNDLKLRDDAAFGVFSDTGSPEGIVTANIGSLFLRTDGGASTSIYVKESGVGNTDWRS